MLQYQQKCHIDLRPYKTFQKVKNFTFHSFLEYKGQASNIDVYYFTLFNLIYIEGGAQDRFLIVKVDSITNQDNDGDDFCMIVAVYGMVIIITF